MKIELDWQGKIWQANLAKPLPISIPLRDGEQNPNCYFSDPVDIQPIEGDGFIGDIQQGGSVNHKKITLSPHGNGTHTECYGHITNSNAVIANELNNYFHIAQLITVTPVNSNSDSVINAEIINNLILQPGIKSIIVRTLPNNDNKLIENYSGTNPPYFTKDGIEVLVNHGIEHLITDLPSVDREQDEGKLLAHKSFWQTEGVIRKEASITELAYIPESISDGLFLLNLQILPIHLDVSPSNPVLFALI